MTGSIILISKIFYSNSNNSEVISLPLDGSKHSELDTIDSTLDLTATLKFVNNYVSAKYNH